MSSRAKPQCGLVIGSFKFQLRHLRVRDTLDISRGTGVCHVVV